MATNFMKVGEFHKVFQHPIKTEVDNTVFTTNPKLVDLRMNLINEEFNELKQALSENNIVEVCDALSDMLYVIYGAGHAFGIDLDKLFASYQRVIETYDMKMPDDFDGDAKYVQTQLAIIDSSFENLRSDVKAENMTNVGLAMVKMIGDIYTFGDVLQIDLNKAFDIVHDSNMTKACRNETEAQETVADIKLKGVYKDPQYKLSDDGKYWIVYDATNGKILKSKYYKPADLTFVKS